MSRFKTKNEGLQQRISIWTCLDCGFEHAKKPKQIRRQRFGVHYVDGKPKQCHECSSRSVQYFASSAENKRYKQLLMLLSAGEIEKLNLQTSFPIIINSAKVTTWRADFDYIRKGKRIVEDVKGGMTTDVFELKKKLVEACYGFTISIVTIT